MIKERINVPSRDPKIRAKDFLEVSTGFTTEQARAEALRCLNCKNPPCVKGCPVGVPIPSFISAVAKGEEEEAIKIIKSANSLPAVCGRVCPQEEQCEKLCVCNKLGAPISIGGLERYVADLSLSKDNVEEKPQLKGKKAAIIGSGPAGLTCAGELAKAGFKVTVYEAFHKAGGVMVYGIPEFRLPKKLVEKEINGLRALGVEFKFNVVVGKTIMLEDLLEENDAVFIGTGAGLPSFQGIKGENLNGVYSANEYLTRVNLMGAYDKNSSTPLVVGEKVAVIGAGNVAMDSARTALRLGAKEVTIVYRRGFEEMPARKDEIAHAKEEGIKFAILTNPSQILGTKKVEGMLCLKMELGEADSSGRRRPVPIEGSQFVVECDQVIVAVGTSPNPLLKNSCPSLSTGRKGVLIVDETGKTSMDKVYAGGDAVTGSATVILAMGAGKNAAKNIIKVCK